jgi:flagellar M-ring protein FliF
MEITGENAVVAAPPPPSGLIGFAQTPGGRNFFLMLGVAAVAAVMSGVWLWTKTPDYRVLFSNYSDRDGGAIVASLQQMNVPYKFTDGGSAILIPAEQVHDVRLKLAQQGLPKGGNVGFELMENQKLGISQFLEQVNFQRALEGELARSVQSLAAVQSARVHLALPKASVFVRDQQKPTASVLLNLHPGRSIDRGQVTAIVHLVASSVPDMPIKNVTVVDQSGTLLSDTEKPGNANMLDPSQLKYVYELQQSIVKRIESILSPVVGPTNVRAEATADIDFSHTEQAAETYKPNGTPNASAIRSQQTTESTTSGQPGASGVPGALTNQPQPNATAPINAPAGGNGAAGANGAAPSNAQKDMTVNYEVDKTVRYVQQPMGGVKRLTVAVVVNYKKTIDKAGKVTMTPLTEQEKTQISDLVKEAMGFNKDRGDSLSVLNSPFAAPEKEPVVETPLWKQPEVIQMAMGYGKYALGLAILAYLYFAVLRPIFRRIMATFDPPPAPEQEESDEQEEQVEEIPHEPEPMGPKVMSYQDNLTAAKELARKDPKMVANVVKAWVGTNE